MTHALLTPKFLVAHLEPYDADHRVKFKEWWAMTCARRSARIFVEKWDAVSAEDIACSWLHADVLPPGAQTELHNAVAGVQLFTDTEQVDIGEVVALMACTAVSDEFEELGREQREQAARCWLAARTTPRPLTRRWTWFWRVRKTTLDDKQKSFV